MLRLIHTYVRSIVPPLQRSFALVLLIPFLPYCRIDRFFYFKKISIIYLSCNKLRKHIVGIWKRSGCSDGVGVGRIRAAKFRCLKIEKFNINFIFNFSRT